MTLSTKLHRYEGRGGVVTYDVKRCIHAAECVRGLPAVFDSNAKPWINPNGADAAPLAAAVDRCPSGALHVARADGVAEPGPAQNTATLSADGPTYLRGDLALMAPDDSVTLRDTRMALCRCGASQNKPLCDGSHRKSGFRHDGALQAGEAPAAAGRRRPAGDPCEQQRPAHLDRRVDAHRDERAHVARGNDVPLPLRRLRQQALLRRHSQEDRVYRLDLACAATPRRKRMGTTRQECLALDEGDGLATLRQRFTLPEGVIYLDGNSLGPMPRQVPARLKHVVEDEWGKGLIRSWNDAGWIEAPRRTSARIARIVGAEADEVTVADSTSVNLFKLLVAAARLRPDRNVLLSVSGDFPTDRYIGDSVAEILGLRAVRAGPDPDAIIAALDERVAVLAVCHVDYRTGRINPMSPLTAAAHAAGALALWDVSHSAGVIDIGLDAAEVDFAVGCGYKYLNGGPGAPAFGCVARRHHELIRQPLTGWLGHAQPFAFADDYVPAPGIDRLQCGTPPMMSLLALEAALEAFDGVDLAALRRKSRALGDLFIRLIDERLGRHGFALASPRDGDVRGSQVSLAHPRAYAVMQALIARGIIGDFRAPDILRFGLAPMYVRFADVFDTAAAIDEIMAAGEWNQPRFLSLKAVT